MVGTCDLAGGLFGGGLRTRRGGDGARAGVGPQPACLDGRADG